MCFIIKFNRSFVYFYKLKAKRLKAVKLVHQFQNLRNQNSSTTSMMIKYLTPSGKGYSNEIYCWGKYPILEKLKICYRKTFLSDTFFEMAM